MPLLLLEYPKLNYQNRAPIPGGSLRQMSLQRKIFFAEKCRNDGSGKTWHVYHKTARETKAYMNSEAQLLTILQLYRHEYWPRQAAQMLSEEFHHTVRVITEHAQHILFINTRK
jgi:hypothetical protein